MYDGECTVKHNLTSPYLAAAPKDTDSEMQGDRAVTKKLNAERILSKLVSSPHRMLLLFKTTSYVFEVIQKCSPKEETHKLD